MHDFKHVVTEVRLFRHFSRFIIVDDLDIPSVQQAWDELVASGDLQHVHCGVDHTWNEYLFGDETEGDLQKICIGAAPGVDWDFMKSTSSSQIS